ncbi:hypothetical protein IC762_17560 [Bradyrhizobium genosp. L]|uniref:hypothetical protein n=1 Tax=Bradyrhizobium genosp. L TaxID=83637 RepID=UPI0018A3166E|nr:hypothetical protein [Bradyrhizobium genosp. L]QPF81634.1 hypothetical protein IC762_17560 [Bradyrhizobium genosp. L]
MRGLQETVPIQDIICSNLGAIERLGGNLYRFWFVIDEMNDSGETEKKVVAKLVFPASNIPDAVLATIAALNPHNIAGVMPLSPKHVS